MDKVDGVEPDAARSKEAVLSKKVTEKIEIEAVSAQFAAMETVDENERRRVADGDIEVLSLWQ